jgi:hypothetical protein
VKIVRVYNISNPSKVLGAGLQGAIYEKNQIVDQIVRSIQRRQLSHSLPSSDPGNFTVHAVVTFAVCISLADTVSRARVLA